jgi:stress response protein YsnF
MGLEQEEAAYYNTEFQQGRTIVTVKDNARQQEAATIMQRNGAYDASRRMSQTSGATEEAQPIQLREERLQATTEQVQTGEVDLR